METTAEGLVQPWTSFGRQERSLYLSSVGHNEGGHEARVLSPRAAALERIKALVLDTLPSAESRRAYRQALDDFFSWCEAERAGEFTKATVNAYRASLEARKLSASTINQRHRPFANWRWRRPTTASCHRR